MNGEISEGAVIEMQLMQSLWRCSTLLFVFSLLSLHFPQTRALHCEHLCFFELLMNIDLHCEQDEVDDACVDLRCTMSVLSTESGLNMSEIRVEERNLTSSIEKRE